MCSQLQVSGRKSVRSGRDRHAPRGVLTAQVPRAASEAGRHHAHVVLCGGDGAPHRLDRLAGVLADGALPGEHHRVAAIEDCVRDVADLGARRHGRVDHRLHHLRRGDAKLVRLVCLLDEELLGEGDALQAELNAEVAARHHQPVGEGEDLVNVLERRRLLDLRDDEGAFLLGHPLCVHDVDQLLDVGPLLHEGYRHVVHLVNQVPAARAQPSRECRLRDGRPRRRFRTRRRPGPWR
mmetsp:Transcript_36231/g.113771  ORF Transcript_36231/g.113771 Transcript_36231/m.113771 type:complete len:237 (-) Transcript_36231:999-1709(-)